MAIFLGGCSLCLPGERILQPYGCRLKLIGQMREDKRPKTEVRPAISYEASLMNGEAINTSGGALGTGKGDDSGSY